MPNLQFCITHKFIQAILCFHESLFLYQNLSSYQNPDGWSSCLFFKIWFFKSLLRAGFNLTIIVLSRHNTRACHDSGGRAGHRAKPDAPRHHEPDA